MKISSEDTMFKDAMRYRFLRDCADPDEGHPYISCDTQNDWGKWFNTHESGDAVDRMIDSHMSTPKKSLLPTSDQVLLNAEIKQTIEQRRTP